MQEADRDHLIEAIDAALTANYIEQQRLHSVITEAQWQSESFRRMAAQAEDNLEREERSAANLDKQRRELMAQ